MRPAAPRSIAAALVLAIPLAAGCSPGGSSTAPLDGLLLVTGDLDATSLQAWFEDTPPGDGVDVVVPDRTTWVAAGRADVLAVSLADGSLRISGPVRAGDKPSWQQPKATLVTGEQAAGPMYFPSWDPEGGRVAALAGPLDADPRLVLIDPSVDSAFEIDLGQPVTAAPPAWVGPDVVAIVTGPDDAPTSILVDTTSGDGTPGPSGARLLASSADGKMLAAVEPGAEPIVVRATTAWLDRGGAIVASVDPPEGAVSVASMALDATGQRLAVAWLERGGSVRVECYDGSDDWRRVASPPTDGAAGAVVAWFR